MAFFRRPAAAPADDEAAGVDGREAPAVDGHDEPAPDEAALPASRMRGKEPLYGYAVGALLLAVAVIQLFVRHGAGAPTHSQTTLLILAVVASLAFFAVLQLRNRTIVGLAAIVAAFFVTGLPKVPNSLGPAHILGLIAPLAFGLIITQRQRKAIMATARTRKARNQAGGTDRASGVSRREAARADAMARRAGGRRRGKGSQPEPTGPRPNARYTPPKTKRAANGKGKGKVAGR